jgi:hypothetical protein
MSSLEVELSWVPTDGMLDPVEAATHAELSIRVAGVHLTECADASASVRKTVLVPSILIAEWIVASWVDVLANERRPLRSTTRTSSGSMPRLRRSARPLSSSNVLTPSSGDGRALIAFGTLGTASPFPTSS